MSNTITLELPNSGHGCDICRHQDKDGLVWGIVNDHPFIGCIPFALLVLLMLFCMFMATAQAFAEAVVGACAALVIRCHGCRPVGRASPSSRSTRCL